VTRAPAADFTAGKIDAMLKSGATKTAQTVECAPQGGRQ
jgi:hypothetical protein